MQMHLSKKLSYFKDAMKKKQGEGQAKRILSSAVYLFSIGGNDYFRLSQNPNMTAPYQAQYVRMVIANLTNSLKVSLLLCTFYLFKCPLEPEILFKKHYEMKNLNVLG